MLVSSYKRNRFLLLLMKFLNLLLVIVLLLSISEAKKALMKGKLASGGWKSYGQSCTESRECQNGMGCYYNKCYNQKCRRCDGGVCCHMTG